MKAKCHEHACMCAGSRVANIKYRTNMRKNVRGVRAILQNILAIILSCLHECKEMGERGGEGGVGEGGDIEGKDRERMTKEDINSL